MGFWDSGILPEPQGLVSTGSCPSGVRTTGRTAWADLPAGAGCGPSRARNRLNRGQRPIAVPGAGLGRHSRRDGWQSPVRGGAPRGSWAGLGRFDTTEAHLVRPLPKCPVRFHSTVNTYARTAKGSNVSVIVLLTIGTSCQLIMSRADAGRPGMSFSVNVISIGSLRLLQANSR